MPLADERAQGQNVADLPQELTVAHRTNWARTPPKRLRDAPPAACLTRRRTGHASHPAHHRKGAGSCSLTLSVSATEGAGPSRRSAPSGCPDPSSARRPCAGPRPADDPQPAPGGTSTPHGVSIRELTCRTGLARNTVRVALRSQAYARSRAPVKLDPFKEEIPELLRRDPKLPGVRVRERIEPLGLRGGKTIVVTICGRCARCSCLGGAFSARSIGRGRSASGICGSPLGWCRSAMASCPGAWVVVCCLGYSRAGAGALIFGKEAPDVLWGISRCLWSLGALPELMVWDREGCPHSGGRPTDEPLPDSFPASPHTRSTAGSRGAHGRPRRLGGPPVNHPGPSSRKQ
jgi:hypothetical protein